MTGQRGPVCPGISPGTPEIAPGVDSVSFLSYKESCVSNWQRKQGDIRPSSSIHQVSIKKPLAFSSSSLPAPICPHTGLCPAAPPPTVSPSPPITTALLMPHTTGDTPTLYTHPPQLYPLRGIQRKALLSGPISTVETKKNLIEPLMYVEVEKIIKKCSWRPLSQLFSNGEGAGSWPDQRGRERYRELEAPAPCSLPLLRHLHGP